MNHPVRVFLHLLAALLLPVRLLLRPIKKRASKRALKKSNGWVELCLEGAILESPPSPRLPPLLQHLLKQREPDRVILSHLRAFVDALGGDPLARGLLVRIGDLGGGWSLAHAIRCEFLRLKGKGITIVVHGKTHLDDKQAFVASCADHVLLPPSGSLAVTGAAASGLFLRETLEHIGVQVEVASKGRYKSAPDQFTRTSRSKEDVEQTRAIIDQIDSELIAALQDRTGLSKENVADFVDSCPRVASQDRVFLDGTARDEELAERIETLCELEQPPSFADAGEYVHRRVLNPLWPKKRQVIGLVEVQGPIVDRLSKFSQYSDKMCATDQVVGALRAGLKDPLVSSAILNINSPGGSVTASDAIYAAAARFAQEKPLVACMHDVAASGGYYVACGSQKIFCSPLTLTGSIGVFAMFPTWPRLAERFGLKADIVKNHRHADMINPWQSPTEEHRSHAQGEVTVMYENFLEIVGKARKKTSDEVDEVAQGRVWTGKAALGVGLVDSLEGMRGAIEYLRKQLSLPDGTRLSLLRSDEEPARPAPFLVPEPSALLPAQALAAVSYLETVASCPGFSDLVSLMEVSPRNRFLAYAPGLAHL